MSPFAFRQAMAAVLFGNLFPRWLLKSLVTHRWNNADNVPAAAAAGWEAVEHFFVDLAVVGIGISRCVKMFEDVL